VPHNRIQALMVHTSRYAFQGRARLAADVGCSRSTISRLLNGDSDPSFRLVRAVTTALEKHLHRPLDPRELLSPDGTYPTASGCELAGCSGCLPDEAYDRDGTLKPAYRRMRPGEWSLAPQRHPGQEPAKASKEAA
jgi:transcriptional regulator with XRE-family HTH domain